MEAALIPKWIWLRWPPGRQRRSPKAVWRADGGYAYSNRG